MIGVVIVSYNSSDVIFDCLESLLGARDAPSRIVVVDNASPDGSADMIRSWARVGRRLAREGTTPVSPAPLSFPIELDDVPAGAALGGSRLALVRAPCNGGYGAGVNIGLAALAALPEISLFWVLNPDTVVPDGVADAYLAASASGMYGMMGCRIAFCNPPQLIQSDGGKVIRWTGVCSNINRGASFWEAPTPAPASLDFISGANLVVSRRLLETVGPMPEDYFLYYEEVDWAHRARAAGFPLSMVPGASVFHHGGTVIGSGTLARRQSPLSAYFNTRNRMRFIRRHAPMSLPTAYLFGLAKIAQTLLKREGAAAWASLLGLHGLPPPLGVRARIAPEAWGLAFGLPRDASRPSSGAHPSTESSS